MVLRRLDRGTLLIACVAVAGGFAVFFVATELFPYGSVNHDEGVYLQQAELLLDGQLWFQTPLTDAFHWWFFVEDGSRLYSKYQPVVPALFALGLATGVPRLVLALVGAGIVAGVGLLTKAAYDTLTGVLAAILVIASPLYLLTTSVFLPYAPATALNVLFACAYVRSLRLRSWQWSCVAGLAVGLAFFARPYTAVLFAFSFICHALWLLGRARDDHARLRARVALLAPTALLGTAFVGITLAYNAIVTGEPLVFPYQAFAPRDGVGFGRRALLGYERLYTPRLALRANGHVLWEFATRYVAAPPFGALAAVVGAGVFVTRRLRQPLGDHSSDGPLLPPATLRLLLTGVFISVVVGNIAFWGNLNILADLGDPTDGFIAHFGPFYHYDLLLPVSALGAAGLVWLGRQGWRITAHQLTRRQTIAFAVVVLLVGAPVGATAEANALRPPVEENAAQTDRYATAYEPFEGGAPRGVIFVPTPYGAWLGHPFQLLRNDAGLDGKTVYALDRSPGGDFAVVDAYPDRDLYRFTYRGEWTPTPGDTIVPHLQPLTVYSGDRLEVAFATGTVGRLSTVRISDGDDSVTYDVTGEQNRTFTVRWVLTPGRVVADSKRLESQSGSEVTFDGSAEISVAVTYVQTGGATVTYRQEVAVEEQGDEVRLLWPPEAEVCKLTPDCGYAGYWVPGGEYIDGISINQSVRS